MKFFEQDSGFTSSSYHSLVLVATPALERVVVLTLFSGWISLGFLLRNVSPSPNLNSYHGNDNLVVRETTVELVDVLSNISLLFCHYECYLPSRETKTEEI